MTYEITAREGGISKCSCGATFSTGIEREHLASHGQRPAGAYVAGWNMPGYLPESEAAAFETIMRYLVRKSVVRVVGTIWMPPGVTAAMNYTLDSYDVENARDEDGQITRDSVQRWLDTHAGDFSSVDDFRASIEDGDETVDIPWADVESELTYGDCMSPR